MTDKRIVLTTCGSQEEAEKIAHHMIERHVAACVNIVPKITSIYRWKDKIESQSEWLLLIKTNADHVARVREAITVLHSYELPECVVLAMEDGSEQYLKWMDDSLKA
jgi:periplasmic divalent cation tolerance protein